MNHGHCTVTQNNKDVEITCIDNMVTDRGIATEMSMGASAPPDRPQTIIIVALMLETYQVGSI